MRSNTLRVLSAVLLVVTVLIGGCDEHDDDHGGTGGVDHCAHGHCAGTGGTGGDEHDAGDEDAHVAETASP